LHNLWLDPPGCSFLGATMAHVPVTPHGEPSDIIIDSGSVHANIHENLDVLVEVLKIKKGHKQS